MRRRGFLLGSRGCGFESRRRSRRSSMAEHWTVSSAALVLRPTFSISGQLRRTGLLLWREGPHGLAVRIGTARSPSSLTGPIAKRRKGNTMTKFSGSKRRPLRVNLAAPIRTRQARTLTHEGGVAYARDSESDLFLLAATNMVGEDSFYERAAARDARFVALVHEVTGANPSFVAAFVPYLRASMLMRTAAIVMAAEYVAAGGANGRRVIAGALQRADEPAEMLGYWLTMHGRNIPMPVKRGIADAVVRLYTERAALRYDGLSR